jgi:hypothetical protein
LRFGYGLAGLAAATCTYFAFDFGLFKGPVWRGAAVAMAIGIASAGLMLVLDRAIGAGVSRRGPVRPKGDWACPNCGAAYVRQATTCSDCHVPLVERSQFTV